VRVESEAWWLQALRDLETARHCRSSGDHYAAAFFCQQAAEKGLKALYIEKRRESPGPTHSLVRLGRDVGVSGGDLTFLRELTPEYVTTRYPDAANGVPFENYDDAIAARLIEGTDRLLRWIDSRIPKP
jgi:HEPN domain-containing protein